MAGRSFLPSKADSQKFCIVMGFVALAVAAVEIVSPRTTPPTRALTRLFYDLFGAYGIAGFMAVIGVFLLSVGFKK